LSVRVRVPVYDCRAAGENVTLTVQVPIGAIDVTQLFGSNVNVLGVLLVIDVTFSAPLPVFAIVTIMVAEVVPTSVFGNASEFVESITPEAVPVPDSVTSCGDPVALSEIVTVPVPLFASGGVNVTAKLQLALAAKVVPQEVPESENPVPETEIPRPVRVLPPLLVNVTLCAVAVEPTTVFPNASVEVESETAAAVGVLVTAPPPPQPAKAAKATAATKTGRKRRNFTSLKVPDFLSLTIGGGELA
jgi:hypothetical protein